MTVSEPSRLDRLEILVEKVTQDIDKLREESVEFQDNMKVFQEELKDQNTKFTYYQQATQWVVNLAFSLITAATVITVASAIFKR
jgi:hypothetical protein